MVSVCMRGAGECMSGTCSRSEAVKELYTDRRQHSQNSMSACFTVGFIWNLSGGVWTEGLAGFLGLLCVGFFIFMNFSSVIEWIGWWRNCFFGHSAIGVWFNHMHCKSLTKEILYWVWHFWCWIDFINNVWVQMALVLWWI